MFPAALQSTRVQGVEDTRWLAWEVQGARVLGDPSWENTPLAMAPPRQCKGLLGQGAILRGQVKADFALPDV